MFNILFKYVYISAAIGIALYAIPIGLLTTPSFQAHVVYLHKIQMTWFKDLDVPETFGFLHNQVTPFSINSSDSAALYAWHILPLELYREHEETLVTEPSGFVSNITSRHAFKLLHDDPEARFVLHLHGAAGTVGSGYRVPNYRALLAGQPGKIHVLTFDYRGFGHSEGIPSESCIILDALAVVNWATNVPGIPPSRILIFGQSLGTAVSIAVSEHFALQFPPVLFAGMVLVAPFVDVMTLMSTYCVAGTVPIVGSLARFPWLFNYLGSLYGINGLAKIVLHDISRLMKLIGRSTS
jgi:abhydrolase domain-containing protein 12